MALFEARSLSVSLKRDGVVHPLFTDVNFSLHASRIYDLVGISGSGKSTLLRVCARMLEYDAGELLLDGISSTAIPAQEWRKMVCLVPQKTSLVPGTVGENLTLPWKLKVHARETPPSEEAMHAALRHAGLSDIELARDVSQLSGGQAARISLLRVFLTKPNVLLLDEVDAALDEESSAAISAMTASLRQGHTTCLRIRHRASDGLSEGTFRLSEGRLSYERT